jgi:hypothetical protein
MADVSLPEDRLCPEPDRIIALVPGVVFTDDLATKAVDIARQVMPKVTGYLSTTLRPTHGVGWFGIYFPDRRIWFLEQGTRPFTMRSLQGKTIPMWVDDPTGAERRANPKAQTRFTVDGRTQVLIFRRVGVKGAQRGLKVGRGGARYPGAPGRIARREAPKPFTTAGRTGGRIARGNIGVAWRNPGMTGRQFLNMAVAITCAEAGLEVDQLYLADDPTLFTLIRI